MNKYILTDVSKELFGVKLFQIKALIAFGNVEKDELGGWIEKEENLAQVSGDAWVYGNAQVSGDAWVYGDARVFGDAQVFGEARVFGDAQVYGNARVFGDAQVYGDAQVSGDAWVYGNAQVFGEAQVFGDAQVYGNARVFGDAQVFGEAQVFGDAQVYGNARVSAKASFTKGRFVGGDDSGKITDITSKTGSSYWKNQYVLGDYEITPIDEVKEKSLVGTEVSVTIGDKTYKAVIKA